MEQVSNLLFWISSGLLVPVIVGLLYFFVRSLLLLGGFVSHYLQRMRDEKELRTTMSQLNVASLPGFIQELEERQESHFTRTACQILTTNSTALSNRLLSEYEILADAELGKFRLLTKFGPILGLMGTLIPMGPALAGLSTGDISSMAYNMQVAFATTVLGLFSGAVGFVLLQVKQRWFNNDLVYLDFLAELRREKPIENKTSFLSTAKVANL